MHKPRQHSCHCVDTKTCNTDRENRLIDAHPIIGFMAIILAFIMGQPPLELVTALGPAPLSDPLSLPLLLRVRDSLTCRLCCSEPHDARKSRCKLCNGTERGSRTTCIAMAAANVLGKLIQGKMTSSRLPKTLSLENGNIGSGKHQHWDSMAELNLNSTLTNITALFSVGFCHNIMNGSK